ncbi:substrate-binding domain-containing protein [Haloarcula sp. S1CR25-12]|uniref:Substrate-binding domain-containing protein n=1 Tax=Haloarcula saliterrae TaxID=2950534 RepID=A0ABU2FI73_9EURY|nr:substrate-binding domain-containing protein [Haloarcula sp. S1CR25-12]
MQKNGNRTRRRFIKGAGVAGSVALAGCGGLTGSGSESTSDKIVFYNSGSLEFDPGTAENIDRFEQETGITVEVNEVPWSNLKTSLTTIWRNQDSQVDVFNGPTWWLADFVSSEWLEPIDLDSDHMNKFPDPLVDLVQFDDQTYMAPEFGKWGTYLYDQQYLEQQGFDSPPGTWDEVLSQGEQLSQGEKSGFAFTWADKSVFSFKQFLYQAGGQLFNDNNEPVFREEGVQALEFFSDLRERGIIPDGISSLGEGGIGDNFVAGQYATVESWTPLGSRAIEEWEEGRVGSARPPEGPGGRATFQDTNGISISAFSERKDAAQQFARFMTTRQSCKNNMLVEGNPCVVPDVYDDQEIKDEYPSWLLEDMRFNLENAQSETYMAQPQVDDFLNEQITTALLGNKDPETALSDAQSNIENLYQDIGLI